MEPTGGIYDTGWYQTDWTWSGSSFHVANNKQWYTTFTDYRTNATDLLQASQKFDVLGIGDVELELANVDEHHQTHYKRIILLDVLYVPSFPANIFGGSHNTWRACKTSSAKYSLSNHDAPRDLPKVLQGHQTVGGHMNFVPVGLLDKTARKYKCPYWGIGKVWLRGQPLGKSSMRGSNLWLNEPPCLIGNKDELGLYERTVGFNYLDEEKTWLKEHYGGELGFLKKIGFSIYDHGHRKGGQRLVKTMMGKSTRAELAALYYNAMQQDNETASEFYALMLGLEACMTKASMYVMARSQRVEFYYAKFRHPNAGTSQLPATVTQLIEAVDAGDLAADIEEKRKREEATVKGEVYSPRLLYGELQAKRQQEDAYIIEKVVYHFTYNLFSPREEEWIRNKWGDIGTFMTKSDLIPWEKEDREKARLVVQAAMDSDRTGQ